jgi:large repetitive protein
MRVIARVVLSMTVVAAVWLSSAHADSVTYAYDGSGRVIQATNASLGQAVFYAYDSAGNITSQIVAPLSTLAISGFSANQGATGSQLTIDGTGFSTTASNNVVTINGVTATVVSATGTQLIVSIPAAATSGTITVQTGGVTANSPNTFAVTTVTSAPTVTGFSPSGGGAGDTVAISGTGFQSTLTHNKVLINGRPALVTAVSSTALSITLPSDVTSGPVQVLTPYGQSTSTGSLIVAPAGYSFSSIAWVAQVTEGGNSASGSVGTGQVGLVLFNGSSGDQNLRAAISGGTGSLMEVLDPAGSVIASGCTSACLYNLPPLKLAGTYTVLIGGPPTVGNYAVRIATARTDGINLSWANEGNNPWFDAVNLDTSQRAIMPFSGTAGQLTEIDFRGVANTWTASLWNSSGQTLWSSTLNSSTTSVTMPALPANGDYNIVFDPQFTGGSFQYQAGIVPTGTLTVGGTAVTVNGGGPNNIDGGPVARVKFSGTVGQKLGVKVSATQGFFYGLNIYYQSSTYPGQVCVVSCGTGYSGGTCTIALPALPVTGTYFIYVQFGSSYYSTASVSLVTNPAGTSCISGIG